MPPDSFDPSAPDNIAPIVVWLGSGESAGITGRVFNVRGGSDQRRRRTASPGRGQNRTTAGARPSSATSSEHSSAMRRRTPICAASPSTPKESDDQYRTRAFGDRPDRGTARWLAENWDPDLTVGEWWERLGLSGWAAPLLPVDCYGRGLNRSDARPRRRTIAEFGALGAPLGMGIGLVVADDRRRTARASRSSATSADSGHGPTGRGASCSASPAPGPTSPACTTQAVERRRRVDRQRPEGVDLRRPARRPRHAARPHRPDVPKHQGITCFAFDMHQPGVEVRPLREMTGHAHVQRGVLHDAVVRDDAAIIGGAEQRLGGRQHDAVPRAVGHRRRRRRGSVCIGARAGTVAGDLERRAGDFVRTPTSHARRTSHERRPSPAATLHRSSPANREEHRSRRPAAARPRAHPRRVTRFNTERHKAVRAAGGDIPGIANFSKLLMGHILRHNRDLGARSSVRAARCTLRRRRPRCARRRARRARRARNHGADPLRAGAPDLRRHGPDPTQHHRRTSARPPEGARRPLTRPVQRASPQQLRGPSWESIVSRSRQVTS